MNKRHLKRIISIIVAVIMVCSSVSLVAFAAIETQNQNCLGDYPDTSNADWSWITVDTV